MDQEVFTSAETSKITGLSTRRLQYWDKTDLAHPSILKATGQGSRRLYSKQDLFQLRVVKRIIDSGISVQSVRRSLAFLRKLLNGKHSLEDLILVSDGYSIYAYRDDDTILDTLHAGQTILRLALGELLAEIKSQTDHVAVVAGKQMSETR